MMSLYDKVVVATDKHLGATADRFVRRQMRSHLQKDPKQLQPNDLRELIDWIQLAMRLVSSDAIVIDRYIADLEALIKPNLPTADEKTSSH